MTRSVSTEKSSKVRLGSDQHGVFGKYSYKRTWVLPVPILPDESLASWLTRAALTQGCDPLVLTGVLWPKWRAWTQDIDRGLTDEQLSTLATVSGISDTRLREAGLQPITSKVTQEPLESLATWPWVLALGSRNRKRYGGLQYCPLCLEEDKRPYYRLQWRLAWHTSCPKHGVSLLDYCSHCGAPVEPHRLEATDHDLAVCATCKNNLGKSATSKTDTCAITFQQAANSAINTGTGNFGNLQLSTFHWFALSRYFILLLRQAARRPNSKLKGFIQDFGIDPASFYSPSTGLKFEMLPVAERTMLLAGVWKLMLAGPENFGETANSASLTQACLSNQRLVAPPPIAGIIQSLPSIKINRTKTTCSQPKPRSRESVLRMYARLQRKASANR